MKKLLVAILLLLSGKLMAATITVASIAELQIAIEKAKPGDIILMKDGVYTTSTDINISKAGTAKQPITIAAQDIGRAEITGSGGFNYSRRRRNLEWRW
jgi:poly(beta-D-mannuronate) lyase